MIAIFLILILFDFYILILFFLYIESDRFKYTGRSLKMILVKGDRWIEIKGDHSEIAEAIDDGYLPI